MKNPDRRAEIESKFNDCNGCKHFDRFRVPAICKRCDVGEHFTEIERETELSEAEAWKLFAGMTHYDD